ncbi:MAG: hypothetical protein V8R23_05685 [Alphaproteobacteria bacterium]
MKTLKFIKGIIYTKNEKIHFNFPDKILPQDYLDEIRESGFLSVSRENKDNFHFEIINAKEIRKIIILGRYE